MANWLSIAADESDDLPGGRNRWSNTINTKYPFSSPAFRLLLWDVFRFSASTAAAASYGCCSCWLKSYPILVYNPLRLGFRPGCTFDGTRLLLSSYSSTFRLLDPKRDTSGPYFFLSSCLLGRLLQLPSPSNLFPLVVVLSSSSSSDFSLSFFAQQEQALTLQISLIA